MVDINQMLMEICEAVTQLNLEPFGSDGKNTNAATEYMEEYGNIFSVSFDGFGIFVFAFNENLIIWDSEEDCRHYGEVTDEFTESFKDCFKRRFNEEVERMMKVAQSM